MPNMILSQLKSRLAALLLAAALGTFPAGCARDVNGDLDLEPFPTEIVLQMTTEGSFDSDTASWYYFVFNFTRAPSVTIDDAPAPFVAGDDRGQNWDMYV